MRSIYDVLELLTDLASLEDSMMKLWNKGAQGDRELLPKLLGYYYLQKVMM